MLYLDSDNVLGDWNRQILAYFPDCKGDIEVLNKMENRSAKIREVYEGDRFFFRDLHVLDAGRTLIELLREACIPFQVLTAIGEDHPYPEIVKEDKLHFFKRQFDIDPNDVIIVGKSEDKAPYANVEAILVDDYERNIAQWEARNGTGILFNKDSCPHTALELILEKINGKLDIAV